MGSYYYDTENLAEHEFKRKNMCLIQTVEMNENMTSKRKLRKTKKARYYQELEGWPATT